MALTIKLKTPREFTKRVPDAEGGLVEAKVFSVTFNASDGVLKTRGAPLALEVLKSAVEGATPAETKANLEAFCAQWVEANHLLRMYADEPPEGITERTDLVADREREARTGMSSLPGWATWTSQEAVDWVEVNVKDLASAKQCLKAMAKAICYLRDHTLITE